MPLLHDIRTRHIEPEQMDDPLLEEVAHTWALRGLSRINRLSRSASTLLVGLRGCGAGSHRGTLRVLDIACGGGDVTVGLQRHTGRNKLEISVDGCDISPTAVKIATKYAQANGSTSHFFVHDVLVGPLPTGYDVIVCSLFLHHLSNIQVVDLMARISDAVNYCVINDLSRGPMGYLGAVVGTRLLTRSPIVHYDGPLSVRAALTIEEARNLAEQAGLDGAAFRRVFPCRWLMTWSRT